MKISTRVTTGKILNGTIMSLLPSLLPVTHPSTSKTVSIDKEEESRHLSCPKQKDTSMSRPRGLTRQ